MHKELPRAVRMIHDGVGCSAVMGRTLAMKHLGLALLVLLAAPAAAADRCLQFDVPRQIAEGRLLIGHFKDAADRPETASILRLPVATCLSAEDPEFRVEHTRTIHIFFQ
jgi:hypothetical protein